MISHVFIGTGHFERAFRFYAAVTGELELVLKSSDGSRPWAGWMKPGEPRPLLLVGRPFEGEHTAGTGQMTALLAPSRAHVDRAHAAALANGGVCAGKPGLRPEYHEHYYSAYIRDPDSNKLCVVCHDRVAA